MSESLGKRDSAKAVLRFQNAILVLKPSAIDRNRNWHIPGGIRDDDSEQLIETGKREVEEETGIILGEQAGKVIKVSSWRATDKGEEVIINATFYLYELAYAPNIVLSEEHVDFAWLTKDNYKNYPANTEVYELVQQLL